MTPGLRACAASSSEERRPSWKPSKKPVRRRRPRSGLMRMARMLSFGLGGRVAVVTGGSSGIGLATARLLLRGGARVAICGRDAARLEAAGRSLGEEAASDRIYTHCCDVLDADGIGSFASGVAAQLGRADILVNNAGEGRVRPSLPRTTRRGAPSSSSSSSA